MTLTRKIYLTIKARGEIGTRELGNILDKPQQVISGMVSSMCKRGLLYHDRENKVYGIVYTQKQAEEKYILIYPMNEDDAIDHYHGQVFDTRAELERNAAHLDFDGMLMFKAKQL